MATKKYLSLERLTEYDELIKAKIKSGDDATLASAKSYTDTEVSKIKSGTVVVKEAEHAETANNATNAATASDAEKLGGQLPSYYAKASDIPTGALADKDVVSESDLDSALAEKVNAASEGNHSHLNKTVLDGITAEKVSNWDASLDSAKSYTDTKTNGMATTTVVDNKISSHNTSATAHSDIRDLISALSTKVNNFLDVDDTTKDQLSEVIEMIEANEGTIESLTSGKVNVSDIVDNLTTSNSAKVLSAKQGVALKGLIDALQAVVDGKSDEGHGHAISDVSGLQGELNAKATQVALDTHDSNTTKHITSTERTNWNAAKTHADSAHAPSNAQANVIESVKVNGTAQTVTSKAVNITVPTKASDIGAAESTHGHAISEITDLQKTLNDASGAITANTNSINAHTDRLNVLEGKVGDGFAEITSAEIQALFA